MITPLNVPDSQLESPLGRTSPLVKLLVATAWLTGLAFTIDVRPPLILAAAALLAAVVLGSVRLRRFVQGAAPLLVVAAGIATSNALFSGSNSDPAAPVAFALGPVRVVWPALVAGLGIAARIVAIATTAVAFGQTTDSTRLVDALVRQGRVPARFGYGALAAYQAIPRLAEDLASLRAARRIRGMRGTWGPQILLGLLIRAIRHGDALAVAMDARAFGAEERTWFRELRWSLRDLAVGLAGLAALILALAAGR